MMLGKKLKELREEKGLMQREVGAIIAVDGAFISKVENGEKPINRDHLKALSEFFNIPENLLQTLWLSDKIYNLSKDEPSAIEALKITIKRINKYE
ncbi:helix-turn-helix domain-containing protein [uncultured Polaribacter sp.]|uniref:helix-turn-helix domain-containing protein n=1 Tax=uncultured Polaribacter sp. TaxID=174711 RepID=UPI0026075D62|nr:helix-turn-helix transcriptional regulator [uncultured Polaribacter sp.]